VAWAAAWELNPISRHPLRATDRNKLLAESIIHSPEVVKTLAPST
jgi:hypothetical protein